MVCVACGEQSQDFIPESFDADEGMETNTPGIPLILLISTIPTTTNTNTNEINHLVLLSASVVRHRQL